MKLLDNVYTTFSRKKTINEEALSKTELRRVLNIVDLTALGVGSTLGVGVYVLAGEVAKTTAGPAVILSFLIAGIASVFSGICYAEFGSRVPRAGSAYIYSYVTVGEFIAFIIGWNLILEYCIGAASVVRGLSTYVDSLMGNVMRDWFLSVMPMNVSFLSAYPDFFACGVTIVFTVGLAFGMKESSLVNNVFTILNVGVVLFVIIAGSIKTDPANWSIPKDQIPIDANGGEGGFLPFGFNGVIKGAAKCFYGFVGFDCIATAGEEAKNPKRNIPLSIVISLTIIFLAYFGVSTVLTMMWPYYLQDPEAPLPFVFEQLGWQWAKWIVSIGAIFGLLASLFGALFPLPRILYAMSNDGLMFDFMGRISPRFKTPIVGTMVAGSITAIMATLFNLNQLVSMMSIGTLMAYSIVAACVMLLRYEDIQDGVGPMRVEGESGGVVGILCQLINTNKLRVATKITEKIVLGLLVAFLCLCLCELCIVIYWYDGLANGEGGAIACVTIVTILLVVTLVCISLQPESQAVLAFSVPLVPFIPGVSLLINMYLMLMLDVATWIRFAVWMAIGFAIYFGYGIKNSKERPENKALLPSESHRKSAASYRSAGYRNSAEGHRNLGFIGDSRKNSINY